MTRADPFTQNPGHLLPIVSEHRPAMIRMRGWVYKSVANLSAPIV
ncbi:hypothetical protein LBMAG10_14570 [Actinomycetes bacterium]|nr:hypothetical protein LBMAG10_14570 [Actinomycetes bacterium]